MKNHLKKSRTHLNLRRSTVSLAVAAALGNPAAYATNITVTTNADSGTDSLREAIGAAAADDTILFASTLTGANSTITLTSGELLVNKNLTINGDIDGNGTPDITISGGGTLRVFQVSGTTTNASLHGLNIVNGSAGIGGGIYNDATSSLSITNSTLSSNSAGYGGGIRNNGSLSITNSTLSNNRGSPTGGGIQNLGILDVTNCTLFSNAGNYGGGIHNSASTLTVTDSTISGNTGTYGAGIDNESNGTLIVINSTLSGNTGTSLFLSGTETIANTVVANSNGTDCSGAIETNTSNWIEDNTCSPAHSGDPALGALANNGGPTQTMLPQAGSGLIDAGENATCAANATDQRGATRPATNCDIGAVERSIGSNTNDSGAGSLRQVIADTAAGGTITFDSSLYGQTITLTSGELLVDKNLTINGDIDGNGTPDITISGGGLWRVFHVTGTTTNASLQGLNIINGKDADSGGGINNISTLTVSDCTLSGNTANYGAGILNDATLNVTNSSLSNNRAGTAGGAIRNTGILNLTNSTLSGNVSNYGGGINNKYSSATLTVTNSTLSGNTGGNYGGGIDNEASATLTLTNSTLSGNTGKGLFAGATEHVFNTVIANSNGADCGDTIEVNTSNWIKDNTCSPAHSGDPALGALANNGGPTKTLLPFVGSGLINAGNNATCASSDQRGRTRPQDTTCDIGAVEVKTTTVANNSDTGANSLRDTLANVTPWTGDIIAFDPSLTGTNRTITLTGSELVLDKSVTINGDVDGDNKADITISGGGLSRVFYVSGASTNASLQSLNITSGDCGASCNGGGILNNANLTINNSTISSNTASFHGGGIYNTSTLTMQNSTLSSNWGKGDGGGLRNSGGIVTLQNSTVFGNTASFNGGGIVNSSGSTLTVQNSTLSNNSAATNGGGGLSTNGTENLINTVIANNTGGDCSGAIETNTSNWIEDNTCTPAPAYSGDPALGALADNGGPTQTMLPHSSSGLIDAGDDATCTAIGNVDQRGITRPQATHCDIGAVERLDGFNIATAVIPATAGTAACTPNPVASGNNSTCSVNANSGYIFTAFSGDCTGTMCLLSNVTSDKTVTGNFRLATDPFLGRSVVLRDPNGGLVPIPGVGPGGITLYASEFTLNNFSLATTGFVASGADLVGHYNADFHVVFKDNLGNVVGASADLTGGLDNFQVLYTSRANETTTGIFTATLNVANFSGTTSIGTPMVVSLANASTAQISIGGAPNYAISYLVPFTINGQYALNGGSNQTVPPLGADHDITVTANPAAGGSVTCSPASVRQGGSSTCAVTPNTGYRFAAFSGDCSGSVCELTNVTGPKAVTANFVVGPDAFLGHTVVLKSSGGLVPIPGVGPDGITLYVNEFILDNFTLSPAGFVASGSDLIGNYNADFHAEFLDSGGAPVDGRVDLTGGVNNFQVLYATRANEFVTGQFNLTLQVATFSGQTSLNTPMVVSLANASNAVVVLGGSPDYSVSYVTPFIINGQYALNGGSNQVVPPLAATHAITATANPASGGTIVCTPSAVTQGNNSSCAATPATGYRFVNFSGDCTGATCAFTNVTGPKTVTANFAFASDPFLGQTVILQTAPGTLAAIPGVGPSGATLYANQFRIDNFAIDPASEFTVSGSDLIGTYDADFHVQFLDDQGAVISGATADLVGRANNFRVRYNSRTTPFSVGTYTLGLELATFSGLTSNGDNMVVSLGSPEPTAQVTIGAAPGYAISYITPFTINGQYALNGGATNTVPPLTADNYDIATVVSPTGGGSVTCTPDPVAKGNTSVCTVSANANYSINTVSGCGGTLSGTTFTTDVITANCTVIATFASTVVNYTVTATAVPAAAGTAACTPNPVASGNNSTCSVNANSGYVFTAFSGDCTGTMCLLSNVTSDKTVTGNFRLATDPFLGRTVVLRDPNGGLVPIPNVGPGGITLYASEFTLNNFSLNTTGFVASGADLVGHYNADFHVVFKDNLGNVVGASADLTGGLDNFQVLYTSRANETTTGIFTATLNVANFSGTTSIGTPMVVSLANASTAQISIGGAPNYAISYLVPFTINGQYALNGGSNQTVPPLGADHDITVTANPAAGGSVTCSPASVRQGGSSTCAVTPNTGYRFAAFSGDCSGSVCELTNVTGPKAVTANFVVGPDAFLGHTVVLKSSGGLVPIPGVGPDGITLYVNEFILDNFTLSPAGFVASGSDLIGNYNADFHAEFLDSGGAPVDGRVDLTGGVNNFQVLYATRANEFVTGQFNLTLQVATFSGQTSLNTPMVVSLANASNAVVVLGGSPDYSVSYVTPFIINGQYALNGGSNQVVPPLAATHAITATANPASGGTIVCTPSAVTQGNNSSCAATPATGYRFVNFSGDCTGATCAFTNVTGPKTVTANFAFASDPFLGQTVILQTAPGALAAIPGVGPSGATLYANQFRIDNFAIDPASEFTVSGSDLIGTYDADFHVQFLDDQGAVISGATADLVGRANNFRVRYDNRSIPFSVGTYTLGLELATFSGLTSNGNNMVVSLGSPEPTAQVTIGAAPDYTITYVTHFAINGQYALNGGATNTVPPLTADNPNFSVAAGLWGLVGLPYQPVSGSDTLAQIFGDDISSGTWEVWKRDETAKNYVALATTDPLDQGRGYWILSQNAATLNVTGSMTPTSSNPNCSVANGFAHGCFAITLTSSGAKQYNLVSYPFAAPLDWSRVRFEVDGTTLYTPSAAETATIASKSMWKYSGSSYNVYDDVTSGMEGTLLPMEGFWVKMLSSAVGRVVNLLIPKP